jgi:hypothetical protein
MMATLGGYLFTLIARRPLGLQGARDGPGAAPGWAAGAGAGAAGHVAAPGCAVHAEVMDTRERVICMSRLLS